MRNFLGLATNVDVMPLLLAVQRQPDLWNAEKLRTTHPGTPHADVEDILLRFNDLEKFRATKDAASVMDEHESVFWPAWYRLPEAHPIIFDLMRRVSGIRLGRVMITRLAPGKRILPHVDGGEHARYYDRHHVVLQCAPGAVFVAGNETVQMRVGEVWWFDNASTHEVVNNSADDRITMIVDIATAR